MAEFIQTVRELTRREEREVEVWPLYDAPYTTPFKFEKIDLTAARIWMRENAHFSLIVSALYLLFIFAGQEWMRKREAFSLRGPLAIWNISLATFSAIGFARCFPEFFHVLVAQNGFHRSLCVRDEHNEASAFWARLFVLSKLVELGDTAFIVLRKQKLIFLHWYHHITVLVCCWYFYFDYEPIFRWYGVMNYFVHAWMYTYYALRAMRVSVPKIVSMVITLIQTGQMVVGVAVNLYTFKLLRDGVECARRQDVFAMHMSMYASYLVLFLNYFVRAYFFNDRSAKKKHN